MLAYFVDGETAAVDYVNGNDGLLMAPDLCGAAAAGPKRVDAAGLRLLRDPRGVRVGGAGDARGVGVRGVLQGAARPGLRTGPHRPSKLNVNGSSLAAGHPFAATGGRIVAQLAKQLAEKKAETGKPVRGLISICAAGGQGVTAILEA